MLNTLKQIRTILIQIIDWFYSPFKPYIPIETFRYAATGGINTVFDILLYFLFYNYIFHQQNLDLNILVISPHIAAFIFVFPITFSSGFIFAKYITFTQSVLKGKVQLIRYGISVGGSIFLNYILLKLFVEYFELYATLSKILTTIIVILYSFLVQKHFTFKTAKRHLQKA